MPATVATLRTQKPPPGTPLDWANPLTRGLMLALPLFDYGSPYVRDYAGLGTAALPANWNWHADYRNGSLYCGTTAFTIPTAGITAQYTGSLSMVYTILFTIYQKTSGNYTFFQDNAAWLNAQIGTAANKDAIWLNSFNQNVSLNPAHTLGTWDTVLFQAGPNTSNAAVLASQDGYTPATASGATTTTALAPTGFTLNGNTTNAYRMNQIHVWQTPEGLSQAQANELTAEPWQLYRRQPLFWLGFAPPLGGASGTLGFVAGAATLALSGAVNVTDDLAFAAGSATLALAADTEIGTLGFVVGSATLALAGDVNVSDDLAFVAGTATLALTGTASTGAVTDGVLTWNSDTFTLNFSGTLAFVTDAAAFSLTGATTTGVLGFAAGGATLALAGSTPPPPPTGTIAFAAGAAKLALSGVYAYVGTLTWLAGSANAPLLHAVAPTAETVAWPMLVGLRATRRGGVLTVTPLQDGDAPLPADARLPALMVTLRSGTGSRGDVTLAAVVVPGEVATLAAAWPDGLPWGGLYYATIAGLPRFVVVAREP